MRASSTTPIPPLRADWTASGACTNGSTAPPRGVTSRAPGGAATTSTTSTEANCSPSIIVVVVEANAGAAVLAGRGADRQVRAELDLDRHLAGRRRDPLR